MAEPVSQTFPALPSALYQVRKFIREQTDEMGLSASSANDVILAVSEACANAVLHSGSAEMDVTWLRTGECIEVTVVDSGIFIRRVPMPELERASGHGIPLMMALMDEVGVREGSDRHLGTTVTLRKCRDW
jgi:anti-sigma regulatory factor (Ser/Thr protein kinase)